MVAAKWLAAWCVLASVLSMGFESAYAQYNFRNNGIQSDRPKWERGGIGSDYNWRGSRNQNGGYPGLATGTDSSVFPSSFLATAMVVRAATIPAMAMDTTAMDIMALATADTVGSVPTMDHLVTSEQHGTFQRLAFGTRDILCRGFLRDSEWTSDLGGYPWQSGSPALLGLLRRVVYTVLGCHGYFLRVMVCADSNGLCEWFDDAGPDRSGRLCAAD